MKRLSFLVPSLIVLLLAAALARDGLTAQTFFEIAAVEHDPSGRLVASLAVPPETELVGSRLTALVDGKRRTIANVIQRPPEPISVVIAIDGSGSMAGAPLAEARQAALDLIDRLNAGDRVAVVSFADASQVLSDFTTDRASTIAAIQSVAAAGTTALYGAVDASAALIEDADTDEVVLVLLSDGVDSGLTEVDRDESIEAIASSGAAVYSFALQLAGEVDVAYLSELANRTGGEFLQVAGEQALGALFASLGRKLGADVSVTVEVAPMPLGEHQLTLRFITAQQTVESDFLFEVVNDGLLAATVDQAADAEVSVTGSAGATATPAASSTASAGGEGTAEPEPPDGAIIVRVDSLVDLDSFDVVVTIGEQEPMTLFPGSRRFFVDSWAFSPGPLAIELRALLRGTDDLVAETSLSVDVEELEPVLTLRRSGSGDSRALLAVGRAQAVTKPVLRILINSLEVVNSDLLSELQSAAVVALSEAASELAEETGVEMEIPPSLLGRAPSPGSPVAAFAPVPFEGEIEARLETPDGELLVSKTLLITEGGELVPAGDDATTTGGKVTVVIALGGLVLVVLTGGGIVWAARRDA